MKLASGLPSIPKTRSPEAVSWTLDSDDDSPDDREDDFEEEEDGGDDAVFMSVTSVT